MSPLWNPKCHGYILWEGGRANVPVGGPASLAIWTIGGATYRTTPRRDCSITGIALMVSPDPAGNTPSTYTIDVRVNAVNVAQLVAVFPDTLVNRSAIIEFPQGTYPVVVGDFVDVFWTAAGDVNGNSEMDVQVHVLEDY